jgi:hypothetical protein
LASACGRDEVQRRPHRRARGRGLARDPRLAGLDLGEVEHVVDEPEQVVAARGEAGQVRALLLGERAGEPELEQLRVAEHGVDGRAQLVAHRGQEAALGLVGRLGRAARGFGGGARGALGREQPLALRLGRLPRGDVAEGHDRAHHRVALAQGRHPVLDREARAVLAPEHLALDVPLPRPCARLVEGALRGRVRRAVGPRVVDELVLRAAHEVAGGPAEHPLRGRVRERREAVAVDAEDAVGGGAQDARRLAPRALGVGPRALARRQQLLDLAPGAHLLRDVGAVGDHAARTPAASTSGRYTKSRNSSSGAAR